MILKPIKPVQLHRLSPGIFSKLIIHPLLSREQARFRRGKSIVNQFVLLFDTANIEDPFEGKKKDEKITKKLRIILLKLFYEKITLLPNMGP